MYEIAKNKDVKMFGLETGNFHLDDTSLMYIKVNQSLIKLFW